jgi:hypothetical protein
MVKNNIYTYIDMEEVPINELVTNRDYYIQYEGAYQDEYIMNGKFKNVRKLGTFTPLKI